jgi:hypothetical protein
MAINTTRYSPDSCECVVEYSCNDSEPVESRTLIGTKIVRACPFHSTIPTPQELYQALLRENRFKNAAENHVRAANPGAQVHCYFDSARNLEISVTGISASEATVLEHSLGQLLPGKHVKIRPSVGDDADQNQDAKRYKPTGQLGSLTIRPGFAEYRRHNAPRSKEDIEKWALSAALRAARSRGLNLYNLLAEPFQNIENHFDFTLTTANGEEYLELMEVGLLAGKAHSDARTWYNVGEMARETLLNIQRKSSKYARSSRPLHLLLYSTHWRFILTGNVLDLLAFWLDKQRHVFTTIIYVHPVENGSGMFERVVPRRIENLANFDEHGIANEINVFGDLQKPEVRADGSVRIPIKDD